MNAIEFKDVTKVYNPLDFWKKDSYKALDGVALEVKKGEVFGLLGVNGAGKTTLMKILLGLLRPTEGTVKIFGDTIENSEIRKKIGYLSEIPYFPKYLKAVEVLSYFSDILGIPASEKKDRIDYVLNTVNLYEKRNTRIKGFSKGMQGRLGLAQAILNDPELLLLDEPMSGLDPLGYKETRDIILNLHKKGKTIFFNSHILSEIEKICDRLAVLHKGRLLPVETVTSIKKRYKSLEDYFVKSVAGPAPDKIKTGKRGKKGGGK
ncbi:MAG: ABC transporter ATP-binding protein [Candidatus Goldiibacteriota bacterium]